MVDPRDWPSVAIKMIKKMLFAAALATTTIASAAPAPVTSDATRSDGIQIVVKSRSGSDAQMTVAYTIDGRAFRLTAVRGATSTLEVTEGGRSMMKVVLRPDGSGQLTNHLGRTYTLAQLKADPSLQNEFDLYVFAVLDPEVNAFLANTSQVICLHPIGFIACAIGGYVAKCCKWHAGSGGDWHIECEC